MKDFLKYVKISLFSYHIPFACFVGAVISLVKHLTILNVTSIVYIAIALLSILVHTLINPDDK